MTRRAGASVSVRLRLLRRRLDRFIAALNDMPGVRTLLRTNDTYNAAGGGLLASGLSFSALFAIVPGLLLVMSLLVVTVDDAAARQRVIDWIIVQVPPLQEVARTVVTNLASGARIGTVVGSVLFLWGASGFYLGLDGAIDRLIPGGRPENPILSRVKAVLAVALLVFAALAAFVVGAIASVVSFGAWAPLLSPLAAMLGAVLVCLAVYLLLPNQRPSLREAAPAAVGAGIGIGALTAFFGVLAPLLVGGFSALGVVASVFVALVWFNWTFQMLLFGAGYVGLRRAMAACRSGATAPPRAVRPVCTVRCRRCR